MHITLWVMAGALAAAFTAGALAQLTIAKDRYRGLGRGQHWVDDFSGGQLKAIGAVKLAGAVGLVVPPLAPLAACGLALFMAGAVTTRFRRAEWALLLGDLVYLGLFAFLAWGRFALAPF
ncbi:DoxX family protein [Actinokineospora sp. G85]|uniref:DoxX family protein n=1 Tax=Actinokineospora sp. G85 TaxID=3406626 RepID=UPI003C71ACD1